MLNSESIYDAGRSMPGSRVPRQAAWRHSHVDIDCVSSIVNQGAATSNFLVPIWQFPMRDWQPGIVYRDIIEQ